MDGNFKTEKIAGIGPLAFVKLHTYKNEVASKTFCKRDKYKAKRDKVHVRTDELVTGPSRANMCKITKSNGNVISLDIN